MGFMGIKKFFQDILQESKVLSGEATKDKIYSSENNFPNREIAVREFERSKAKLFDVDRWSDLSDLTSDFELYDQRGQRAERKKPEVGDFIRILLPGPTPENWVKVTDIKITDEAAEFTVSPCEDPREKEEVEHFFIKEATSTFRVKLIDNTIHAAEIGKNEGINNQGEEAGERKVLNTLIAEGGWAAFQELQWKKLTAYLVHKEEIEE